MVPLTLGPSCKHSTYIFLLNFYSSSKEQPLQEALYLFQNLIISSFAKKPKRGTKFHMHFIIPPKLNHNPLLEIYVYSMLSESTSKTETQNDPEYMLYFPSQDYRHGQNQTMALGFCFSGF